MSSTSRHAAKRRANRKAVAPARVAARRTAYDQWPFRGPSVSSVRRWLKEAEAEGGVRHAGVEHTGRPGRPAHLWELTEKGRENVSGRSLAETRTILQARKIARMHGLSYEAATQVLEHASRRSYPG
jgi:DNA-binding PadR family transcriptional regulator